MLARKLERNRIWIESNFYYLANELYGFIIPISVIYIIDIIIVEIST